MVDNPETTAKVGQERTLLFVHVLNNTRELKIQADAGDLREDNGKTNFDERLRPVRISGFSIAI
jgi:hypothetical protein